MGAKQIHDAYGTKVMREAFPDEYDGNPCNEPFGLNAGTFKIDCTIGKDIAVEIESRASKQVRGAIVDVICHPHPKKLIVLIKMFGNRFTEDQCRALLTKFAPMAHVAVVSLAGTGTKEQVVRDVRIIRDAVRQLRETS